MQFHNERRLHMSKYWKIRTQIYDPGRTNIIDPIIRENVAYEGKKSLNRLP